MTLYASGRRAVYASAASSSRPDGEEHIPHRDQPLKDISSRRHILNLLLFL